MQGPYNLTETDIDFYVKRVAGAYILSRGSNAAHYVGRSDVDLNARLKQYIGEGTYIQFWFEATPSLLEAYYRECEWYHKYRPIANSNHPAVPPGSAWKCPITGCPFAI